MNKNRIVEKVKRGIELLDEKEPDWADKIDLSRFDLESPCNCVLGQVFQDYLFAIYELHILDEADYGFDGNTFQDTYEMELIWLQEINERRNNE